MDTREQAGLQIAIRFKLIQQDGVWIVPSENRRKRSYRVTFNRWRQTCNCKDQELNRQWCKHIWAVEYWYEQNGTEPPSDLPRLPHPRAPKPTYSQPSWKLYNRAKTSEKHVFQELLADLCRSLPTPRKLGRPRVPVADMIFAVGFKVYTGLPEREFMPDLEAANAAGHISHVPHFNMISRCFAEEQTTEILLDLITSASLPLKAVETSFAADSTGFGTSRFLRWRKRQHGFKKDYHDWVKAHMMCGVKTAIITAVEITPAYKNDSPYLPVLLDKTMENFQVREVMADKGYSSVGNLEVVEEAGAKPYIAFKKNAVPDKGGTWARLLHYFRYRREDFLKHYHQRSLAEAAFSMIKRKFGDAVRSRDQRAMENEVLAKILCHNVCRVIGSMFELGIDPAFDEDRKPA